MLSNFTKYVKQIWKNKPDTSSPLNATRLNHIEDGIENNSNAISELDTSVTELTENKASKENYPNRFKLLSIATDNKTNGFVLTVDETSSFNILMITDLCTAIITRISNGEITVTPIVGKFTATYKTTTKINLRLATYVRATFLIDCEKGVTVETYTSPNS